MSSLPLPSPDSLDSVCFLEVGAGSAFRGSSSASVFTPAEVENSASLDYTLDIWPNDFWSWQVALGSHQMILMLGVCRSEKNTFTLIFDL